MPRAACLPARTAFERRAARKPGPAVLFRGCGAWYPSARSRGLCLAAALLSAQDLGSSAECRNREQNGSGREKRAEVEARNEELGPTMTTRHHPELSVHALSVHRSLIPRYHVPSAKDRQGALCLLQQAQETRQRDKRQDASQRDKHKEKKDRTSHIQKKELRRLAPVLGTDFEGKHDVIDKEGTAVQSSVDACLSSTEQRDKDPKQVIVVLVAEIVL